VVGSPNPRAIGSDGATSKAAVARLAASLVAEDQPLAPIASGSAASLAVGTDDMRGKLAERVGAGSHGAIVRQRQGSAAGETYASENPLGFLAASPIEARSTPVNTLPDLWRELSACVKVPGDGAGSELTIIFALKRDGSLLGKPRITQSHLLGDGDAQNAFVAGAIGALAKCLPISITDDLGGAIAGRPLSIRIGGLPKQTDT
jgi:hypothetical protein